MSPHMLMPRGHGDNHESPVRLSRQVMVSDTRSYRFKVVITIIKQ